MRKQLMIITVISLVLSIGFAGNAYAATEVNLDSGAARDGNSHT